MRRTFRCAILTAFLFGSFPAPAAASSADLNGDGSLDISDAVYLLSYLFLGAELGNPASDQRKACIFAYPYMDYGLHHFADNGDGTFSHKITGLTWQRAAGPRMRIAWEDRGKTTVLEKAVQYCEDLVLGGRDDWRLPNIIELLSLNPGYCFNLDYRIPCPLHEFLGLKLSDWHYLASSTPVPGQGGAWVYAVAIADGALTVTDSDARPLCVRGGKPRGSGGGGERGDLNSDGNVDISDAIFFLLHLFCGGRAPDEESCLMATGIKESIVPGDDGYYQAGIPQPSERFVDLGNGAVRDRLTGLLWTKNTSSYTHESEPPQSFIREVEERTGLSEWKTARLDDLVSIIDFSRAGPAADPVFDFPESYVVQATKYTWGGCPRVIVIYSSSAYGYKPAGSARVFPDCSIGGGGVYRLVKGHLWDRFYPIPERE